MTASLGKWAVIDIETTGIDAAHDSIIDIGFLQFDGTELIHQYSSLVQYDGHLSHFIQKLTGITPRMLTGAPAWKESEVELQELFGHHLIAHNAGFERSFLEEYFDKIDDGTHRESFDDSLYFLAVLFPEVGSLSLENFIVSWNIADQEIHRGFQDSLDLLKVMLVAVLKTRRDSEKYFTLTSLFKKYHFEDYWFYKFFSLDEEELFKIAEQIEFDLEETVASIAKSKEEVVIEPELPEQNFSLEFSGANVQTIFQDEKYLKSKLSKYSYRESQKELGLRAGQSFKNGIHTLVQAPTGTGKTLGYLIPAMLFSVSEKKQVLVSTGTKTLQHQAMTKDIPEARKILGLGDGPFKVAELKGAANHLCELLFRQSLDEEEMFHADRSFEEKYADLFYDSVFYFNSKSTVANQLLRDDLPYVIRRIKPVGEKDSDIAVDLRSCAGFRCPYKDDCTYQKSLKEAKDANLIVGNHALMFSWPRSFPRPEHLIVDEAHRMEGDTTNAFSVEVSQVDLEKFANSLNHMQGIGSLFYLLAQTEEEHGSSTEIINNIRSEVQSAYQMMMDHINLLPEFVELLFKKGARYSDTYWNEMPMITNKGRNDELAASIYNHFDSVKHILAGLEKAIAPYRSRWELGNLKEENLIIAFTRFETFMGVFDDLLVDISLVLETPEDYCASLKYHETHGYMLLASPIDIGKIVHEKLLEVSSSVFYTSATLGNANGDQGTKGIEWATGYSYLEPQKRFKSGFYLPAVYDYKNKTKVFLCDDMPPMYAPNFVEKCLAPVVELIRNLKGRSLLLFSAKTRFELAREILLKEFDGEIPLFIQGMGNKVIEEFKKSGEGILLGMESFGEGIDVPGDALQFVFIDKIPDLRMDLVIKSRRDFYERSFGNEFTDYYLATRTRSLHQKLGRLLRTEVDYGGVIVVDSRIKGWHKSSIDKFFKLMEPYDIQRNSLDQACKSIEEFIGTGDS